METGEQKRRIGIIGSGPSGLFLYKRLLESGNTNLRISIFEKSDRLGAGMPHSPGGSAVMME